MLLFPVWVGRGLGCGRVRWRISVCAVWDMFVWCRLRHEGVLFFAHAWSVRFSALVPCAGSSLLSEVASSERGTELFLYVACGEDLAQRICAGGVIKAGFFGPTSKGWIPFAGSNQVALANRRFTLGTIVTKLPRMRRVCVSSACVPVPRRPLLLSATIRHKPCLAYFARLFSENSVDKQ